MGQSKVRLILDRLEKNTESLRILSESDPELFLVAKEIVKDMVKLAALEKSDTKLRAAFKDAEGALVETGAFHNIELIPDGFEIAQEGYVDADGKFYSRQEAAELVNIPFHEKLDKSEMGKLYFKEPDGITIPAKHTSERIEYDRLFKMELAAQFEKDGQTLVPVLVKTEDIRFTGEIKYKTRYDLYKRMVDAGDELPPIVISGLEVVDGTHRTKAALDAGIKTLKAFKLVKL